MAQPIPQQIRLQRQSRVFRVLALMAALVTMSAVFTQIVSAASPLWKGGPVEQAIINTGKQIALSVPAMLYVAGLYCARGVFRRIGGGEIFARANGQELCAMGWCLLGGALWAMSVEGLVPYTPDQPIGQTMHEVGRSATDPVLAAIGLALLMIGRVMATASRIKAENDEFV